MAYADEVFKKNCLQILEEGCWDTNGQVRPHWEDGSSAHTVKSFAIVNRYDLSREFPILTLRNINFSGALDEILWIWQKKSADIHDLNTHIWDAWADENGSIGKAYGYQLGVKYDLPEGKMDQVDMLLYLLKNDPLSRRMVTNIFVHRDLREMRLYPCAYSLTLNVSGNRLNGMLNQRSQDMLVANNWNVVQYAALLFMFARAAGLQPGELVHVIADAHIYDRHIPLVKELLEREAYPGPTLLLDESISDFYAFRPEHFRLVDYQHHGGIGKIPVAI